MAIVPALDEGPIIAVEHVLIPADETAIELTDRLVDVSNKLIQRILPDYVNGLIEPQDQDKNIQPTYTFKLKKSDGGIIWTKPAVHIEREVRGFWGWPGSRTNLLGRDIIITKARVFDEPTSLSPGQVAPDRKRLIVGCGDAKALEIIALKPAGKNEMTAQAFLNGQSI
jgi:methionyl-tRNA formyltransferase